MTEKLLDWLSRYNLIMFDEIDSTNLEARRLIESGINDDFVIVASKQNNGKGRTGSNWVSEEGNLYLSIILRPYGKTHTFPQLSFITSLALYDTISALSRENNKSSLDMKLKWPNDVLVNNHKISGILLEFISHQEREYLVIGVGINVNNNPNLLDRETISLSEIFSKDLDINYVLGIFMSIFHKYYRRWQMDQFGRLKKLWMNRAYKIGEVVTIVNHNNRISGTFVDINNQGAIRLRLASGQIFTMYEGSLF